jgi:hypothetical protein
MNGRLKSLFGLFLLALAFLPPTQSAWAVNCFWVGGSGTWEASSTTNWAPTSGGAATGCQTTNAAPAAGDTITFNGSSGGGTVTPTTAINGIAFGDLNVGAFTGTIAFNTNNPTMSVNTFNNSGTGARTINQGGGGWTYRGGNGFTALDLGTQTNCTSCVYSNTSHTFSGTGASRLANLGTSLSLGAVTISDASAGKGVMEFTVSAATMASLTVGAGTTVLLTQGATTTITGALAITGTSSAPSGLQPTVPRNNVTTVSVGSASTCNWCAILRVTKSGAGSLTATNSLDLGGNTNITITPPSGGGNVISVGGFVGFR